jgi:hypothetical protein
LIPEGAHELGNGGLSVAAGTDQAGGRGAQEATPTAPGGVQLDLDLPELPRRTPAVEHRDSVVDNLGQELAGAVADLDRPPDGSQTGHRLDDSGPGGGEYQVGGGVGDLVGRAVDADLAPGQARPPPILGELHGPGGAGLPVAVAKGDPRARQTQIGGVVVGGVKARRGQRDGRGARHQARQVRQSEPGWRHELGLALDSCSRGDGLLPHLGDDRRVPAHPTGPKDPPGPTALRVRLRMLLTFNHHHAQRLVRPEPHVRGDRAREERCQDQCASEATAGK